MTTSSWGRVAEILERALELEGEERRQWIESSCGNDPKLASQVARLLAADARAAGFLQVPEHQPLTDSVREHVAGTRVGAYTIRRRIGAGGMGAVYEAEQDRPQRLVALKLVDPLLTSESALRRFAFEAEMLGRLRHPGIAQVFESGVDESTGSPRPFLAMEFVEGALHVHDWVRTRRLGPREVVALCVEICAAIEHGHEKGVIHRDIKPSNVLVDLHGRPKVIDFGVARTIESDATRLTRDGDMVGTLQSMSPEQLAGDSALVDVRSDVYALGVLLYELLAGRPPHPCAGLSITEAVRRIREDAPARLDAQVPGVDAELDWVVQKALEKDRERRYASVRELAADLRHWLAHEPVLAVPPSATYRMRKFVRRHRVGVFAATAILTLLVGGLIAALLARDHAIELMHVADVARLDTSKAAARLAEELDTNREIVALQSSWLTTDELQTVGRDVRLADQLDRAAAGLDARTFSSPFVEAQLRTALARSYFSLALWNECRTQARAAHAATQRGADLSDDDEDDLARMDVMSTLELGQRTEALALAEQRLAVVRPALGDEHARTAQWRSIRANALMQTGAVHEAVDELRAAIPALQAGRGSHPSAGKACFDARLLLARALRQEHRHIECDVVLQPLLEDARSEFGPRHASTLQVVHLAAACAEDMGHLIQARRSYEELLSEYERRLGPESDVALRYAGELARVLQNQGELARAEEMAQRAVDGTLHGAAPATAAAEVRLARLASIQVARGRLDDGFRSWEQVLAACRSRAGDDVLETIQMKTVLATDLLRVGRPARAAELAREAWTSGRTALPEDHPRTLRAANVLAHALSALGQHGAAAQMQRGVVESLQRRGDPLHKDVLVGMHGLLQKLRATGDIEEAACIGRDLVARRVLAPDIRRPGLWSSTDSLAVELRELGLQAEARTLVAFGLAALDVPAPSEPALLVGLLREAGRLAAENGRFDLALEHQSRALEIAGRDLHGDDLGPLIDAETALSTTLAQRGDLAGAAGLMAGALERCREHNAPADDRRRWILEALARIDERAGNTERATALRAELAAEQP